MRRSKQITDTNGEPVYKNKVYNKDVLVRHILEFDAKNKKNIIKIL